MSTFLTQIKEDILDLKNQYNDIVPQSYQDDWWLNFWILEKIFSFRRKFNSRKHH